MASFTSDPLFSSFTYAFFLPPVALQSIATLLPRHRPATAIPGLPRCWDYSLMRNGFHTRSADNHVKKKVEEALRHKMKQKALKECDHYIAKYAQCASGRSIPVVWQCLKQFKELNDSLHQLCKREKKCSKIYRQREAHT